MAVELANIEFETTACNVYLRLSSVAISGSNAYNGIKIAYYTTTDSATHRSVNPGAICNIPHPPSTPLGSTEITNP